MVKSYRLYVGFGKPPSKTRSLILTCKVISVGGRKSLIREIYRHQEAGVIQVWGESGKCEMHLCFIEAAWMMRWPKPDCNLVLM